MARRVGQVAREAGDTVRAAFRGKITLVVSSEPVQRVQLSGLADETLQDLEHLQEFGFTSSPPEGTEAVVIPLGGNTSHGMIVATEHGSFRVKNLKPGETAIYSNEGAKIVIKQGRIIEADCDVFKVNCKSYQVSASDGAEFDTPNLSATQQVTAAGQINGNGGMAVQGGSGVKVTGNVEMTGDLHTTGALTNNGKDVGSGHRHTETNGSETGEVV